VGAAVWVPPIIDSFTQPAAAGSPGPCARYLNGSGFSVVSVLLLNLTTKTAYEVVYQPVGPHAVSTACGKKSLPGGGNGRCGVTFLVPMDYTLATGCPSITATYSSAGGRPTLTLTDTGADSYTVWDWVIHQGNCCAQLSKECRYSCAPKQRSTILGSNTAVFYAPSPCSDCTSSPPCPKK
jgi:hypothetical protein